MTQTLMDFLKIVTPAAGGIAQVADTPVRPCAALTDARQRMDQRLARLNRQVAGMLHKGQLLALPLCPSACEPGILCDFIFSLGTDPFRRWNMMIYADSAATAQLLDTLPYHPDYATDTDAVMVDYLQGLIATRDAHFDAHRDMTDADKDAFIMDLRSRLIRDCSEIEAALFGARKRLWRIQGVGPACDGTPPNASINPAISSGNGAEYRI